MIRSRRLYKRVGL